MQTNPFRAALAFGAFALLGTANAANAQSYVFDRNIGNGQLAMGS